MKKERVAVLGASPKAQRYSNRAIKMLLSHGHTVVPVNPGGVEVGGQKAVKQLSEIEEPIDTLTFYVGPHAIGESIGQIVELNPARVILNPGTESAELKAALSRASIPYEEACTLVMLSAGTF